MLGLLVVLAAHPGSAAETGKGKASFTARGPAGMKIEGSTEEATVSGDAEWLTVSVPLASLKTGIELRDNHLRNDLEVAKFPTAELKVRRALLKVPEAGAEVEANCAGELTLHGQTKPVTFNYRAKRGGAGLEVEGSLHLNFHDFGVEVPSYLGITVKPEVDTQVSLHLNSP